MFKSAPDAHLDWLRIQGFEEKEALRIKWLSKDMNDHDVYMNDFLKVFETLERWGPGSAEETLKALSSVPYEPQNILEIGCGNGVSTLVLAKNTKAKILATDNEQSALDRLASSVDKEGLSSQVSTKCISMTELDLEAGSFDLIWAEACAYVIGVESALHQWEKLLTDNSVLMLSDLVWLSDNPSDESKKFWKNEYPDMQTVEDRKSQIKSTGYKIIDIFTLDKSAWVNYYEPLKVRADFLENQMKGSQALDDIYYEVELYEKHLGEFGYQVFVMQRA